MTTKSISAPLIWAILVGLLLGGAYLIVARNPSSAQTDAPAAYVH
jgi:hypothetical protein